MAKRKIAIIVNRFFPALDGIGHYAYYLAKAFMPLGYDVSVVCKKNNDVSYYETNNISVYSIIDEWDYGNVHRLLRLFEQIKPDLVLFQYSIFTYDKHGTSLPMLYLCLRLRLGGFRLFTMFHETRNKAKRFGPMRNLKVLVQIIFLKATHLFSEKGITSIRLYQKQLALPFKKAALVRVGSNIPNTLLDSTALVLGRKKWALDGKQIIGVFGYEERFGELMLEAFLGVSKKHPNARLLVVGRMSEKIRIRLDDLPNHFSHLKEKVVVAGEASAEDVSIFFKMMDVYLALEPSHSSNVWTGSSTKSGTLAAGLSEGLPVIGVRGEKTDDFFNGENVYLLDFLNVDNLNDAICFFLESEDAKSKFAMSGYKSFCEHLSWEIIAQKYDTILNDTKLI
jgi:glycosyltransferase involved in cell wall biosynthesis